MHNKYVKRAKISEAKFRELARLFTLDMTATQIADLTGLNRNTVNRYLKGIRQRIAEHSRVAAPSDLQNWELNRGPSNRRLLVGLRADSGKAFAVTVGEEVLDERGINLDEAGDCLDDEIWRPLDLLIDPDRKRRFYCVGKRSEGRSVNAYKRLDSFWGYARSRLEKFKGMHASTYRFHLKECEFRFNHTKDVLYPLVLRIVRNNPLF